MCFQVWMGARSFFLLTSAPRETASPPQHRGAFQIPQLSAAASARQQWEGMFPCSAHVSVGSKWPFCCQHQPEGCSREGNSSQSHRHLPCSQIVSWVFGGAKDSSPRGAVPTNTQALSFLHENLRAGDEPQRGEGAAGVSRGSRLLLLWWLSLHWELSR